MRDQEIIGLQEAYLQVYAQPQEEVEQLDENRAAMRNPEAYEEGERRGQSRRRRAINDPHTGINSPAFGEFMRKQMGGGAKPKEKEQKEEVEIDIFDYLLEYLVAEGYADTNKAALAIMANMSEEWKQSIIEDAPLRDEPLWDMAGDKPKTTKPPVKKPQPQVKKDAPMRDEPLW